MIEPESTTTTGDHSDPRGAPLPPPVRRIRVDEPATIAQPPGSDDGAAPGSPSLRRATLRTPGPERL